MPETDEHHEAVLRGLLGQLKTLFRQSPQGMYVYLDDHHAACNEAMAKMLGYRSPAEWAAAGRGDFMKYVEKPSQEGLVQTYRKAMEKAEGAQVPVTWLRRDGKPTKTTTILVPIDFDGHRFALHFLTPA